MSQRNLFYKSTRVLEFNKSVLNLNYKNFTWNVRNNIKKVLKISIIL